MERISTSLKLNGETCVIAKLRSQKPFTKMLCNANCTLLLNYNYLCSTSEY